MHLSIVIVNWNTRDLLRACLNSIPSAVGARDLEVIVLDNHSADQSAGMVRKEFPNVKLIASERNLGFGPGNNAAITYANGEYILLLNPDTELRGDVLLQVLDYMRERPEVGAAGVQQIETDGTRQCSCGDLPSLAVMFAQACMCFFARRNLYKSVTLIRRLFGLKVSPHRDLAKFFDFNQIIETDWIMGAFMMLRRDVVQKTKLFDESFKMYGEDLDLCARIHHVGKKVVYFGRGEILHHGSITMRSIPVQSDGLRFVAMVRYYQKHHPYTAWLYRLILGSASFALWFKGLISKNLDSRERGKTRLRAAVSPSWGGFLDRS